jgi:hydrogenase maturation protein HypF
MESFPMCSRCRDEYENPRDRRFHAQPIACPDCGPNIWIENADGTITGHGETALASFTELIRQGKIVAVKGLGGFHLACDAKNSQAVQELRSRKLRVDKPFAIMMPDIETVRKYFHLNQAEELDLQSIERPVVLLERPAGSPLAKETSPNLSTSGIMLAYSPLHVLLFTQPAGNKLHIDALVMTSGNVSEEPIAYEDADARFRLQGIADAFLMHNRPIHIRCDDSVVRVLSDPKIDQEKLIHHYPIRRSRGYAPTPLWIPWKTIPILGCGAELKNTFCLAKDQYAFMSHHIGDLENYETYRSYEQAIEHYEKLFRVNPEILVHDLHPDYVSTRYALEQAEIQDLRLCSAQHHHAHIASCMADRLVQDNMPVIGIAFDGTGYGEDGAIWGGEFLVSSYTQFQRFAHLQYIRLPGGDKAIREPWRIALSWLHELNLEWSDDLSPVHWIHEHGIPEDLFRKQIAHSIQCPDTSSMGRLFDAIASLVGLRNIVNYEAQGAIELEAVVNPDTNDHYPFSINNFPAGPRIIDPAPIIHGVIMDLRQHIPISDISAKFHNSIMYMVLEISRLIRLEDGITTVALSGGVWQNMTLLRKTIHCLQKDQFHVLWHHQVPANDGGISLGQVAIAIHRMSRT